MNLIKKDGAIITLAGRVDIMRFKTALYYISIGVYPGPQDHFESGEVIDKSKL